MRVEGNEAPPAPAPLRVGLILDRSGQPRWVRRMIERFRSCPYVRLVLVAQMSGAGPGARARTSLYSVVARVDRWRQRRRTDPLEVVSIEDLLTDCARIHVGRPGAGPEPDTDPLLDALRSHDLDVLVYPGPEPPPTWLSSVAKHGLWYFRHGTDSAAGDGPPAVREVVSGEPTVVSTLWAASAEGHRCLYRSVSRTDRLSVAGTLRPCYWKAAHFVPRALRDLCLYGEVGWAAEQSPPGDAEDARSAGARRDVVRGQEPRTHETLALVTAIGGRWLRNRIVRLATREQWIMAYQMEPLDAPIRLPAPDPERLKLLRPPPDRIWADPFPVRLGDRYVILFEEMLDRTGKGHIAAMEVGLDGEVGEPHIVLTRDYHLAYPFLFEWNGERFMIPDSADNRTIELYRADRFPGEWKREHVLVENVWATDTTLLEHAGRWWMFTTIGEPGNFDCDAELHIFHAPAPTGPWTPHRRNPVKSDVRSARGAGRFIRIGQRLYRPAQDCAWRYGHAIVLHEIQTLDESDYSERAVARIEPAWTHGLLGTHTLNSVPGITVFDGLARRARRNG